MQVKRLIFRGHLLPAFVTPFRHVREFMQVMHPEEMTDIANLRSIQQTAKFEEREKEFKKINTTILNQV
jgi:hypothetical protein